jgi:hypothetical protein
MGLLNTVGSHLFTYKRRGEESFNNGDISTGRFVDHVQLIHRVQGVQLVARPVHR